jgi:hypothetical protein
MRATHARVVRVAVGDLPPCRHGQRMSAILKYGAIVNFVNMQGNVKVVAVALRRNEGG